ncbi:hypothetical protein BH11BAC6_BH11BAC6_17600 [soil metagenome]
MYRVDMLHFHAGKLLFQAFYRIKVIAIGSKQQTAESLEVIYYAQ